MRPKNHVLSLAGRIGAYTLHGRYDSRKITAPARAGFLRRFLQEADPAGTLPPAERQRRAKSLLKAHMTRLALRSAQVRRRRSRQVTQSKGGKYP